MLSTTESSGYLHFAVVNGSSGVEVVEAVCCCQDEVRTDDTSSTKTVQVRVYDYDLSHPGVLLDRRLATSYNSWSSFWG